jgi:hypothetical protein
MEHQLEEGSKLHVVDVDVAADDLETLYSTIVFFLK